MKSVRQLGIRALLMKTLITFIGFLIASHAAFAASFDCKKASTKVERMICADADLGEADQWLANYYTRALLGLSAERKEMVRNDQKGWLSKRNLCKDKQCIKSAIDNQFARLESIATPQLVFSSEKQASVLANKYNAIQKLVKNTQTGWSDVESLNIKLSVWEDTQKYLIVELEHEVFFLGIMRSMRGRSYHLINKNTDKLESRSLIDDLEDFNDAKRRDIMNAHIKSDSGKDCGGLHQEPTLKLLYTVPSKAGIGLIRDVPNVAYGSECDVAFVLPWSVAKPHLTNFGKQLMKEFTGK